MRTNVRRPAHECATASHELRTDTRAFADYVSRVRKTGATVLFVVAAMAVLSLSSSAEGGPPYRRTTPRGSFGADGPELLVGVPGGRAWGIESALLPVPAERTGNGDSLALSPREFTWQTGGCVLRQVDLLKEVGNPLLGSRTPGAGRH